MVASMMLMGLPFLVFGVSDALPIVVAAVVVFVFGEMLWVPTMLAVVADRAPAAQRGAYMGAFSATSGAAFALTPLVGLQVLGRAGDQAMWALIAAIALIGAAAFATVLRH
jgi:MFS family permease